MHDPNAPGNPPVRPPRPAVDELGIGLTDLLEADVTLVVGGKDKAPKVELEIELKSGRTVTRPLHTSFLDASTNRLRIKELAGWLHMNEASAVEALVNSNAQAAEYVDKERLAEQLGVDADDPLSSMPVTLHKGRRSGWTFHLKPPWVGLTRLPLGQVTALADKENISDELVVPAASPISDDPGGQVFGAASVLPLDEEDQQLLNRGCLAWFVDHKALALAGLAGLFVLLVVASILAFSGGSDDGDEAGDDRAAGATDGATDQSDSADLQGAIDNTVADGTGVYTTEVVLPVPADLAAQTGIDEVTLTGEGWYDLSAPAWGVTMDLRPFLEVGGPIGDLDADVTATWIDDTYYLSSEVIAAFSGGRDTVQSPTIEELAVNEDLAATPIGSLTLPLVTNPIGNLLSLGGAIELDDDSADPDLENLVIGDLPLIGAYGEVVRIGDRLPPALDGRAVVHDTHVVQFGVEPDPVLEDFRIEISYTIGGDDRLSFASQFIDFEKAIPLLEDELDDAESLAGTSVRITYDYRDLGQPLEVPSAPSDAMDLDTVVNFAREF